MSWGDDAFGQLENVIYSANDDTETPAAEAALSGHRERSQVAVAGQDGQVLHRGTAPSHLEPPASHPASGMSGRLPVA